MPVVVVVTGLARTFVAYAVERSQPKGLTRGKAIALALWVVGEILLFGAAWWWALIGLAVPPLVIGVVLAAVRRL